jgi:tetratricopeptide (TPR) repeat protein
MTGRRAPVILAIVAALCGSFPVNGQVREDPKLSRAVSRCTKLAELLSCYEALALKPNSPDLLVAEADALVQAQRPGEAMGVYRNALRVGGPRQMVDAKIALAAMQRRTMLDSCLALDGAAGEHACASAWLPGAADEVAVFKRRGFLLQGMGQPSAALDAYMAAARLRPKDHETARYIVGLCNKTGREDAAAMTALRAAKDRLRFAERTFPTAAPSLEVAGPAPLAAGGPAGAAEFSNQAAATRSH